MTPLSLYLRTSALLAGLALFGVASGFAIDRGRLTGGTKEDFLTGAWGGQRTAWSGRGLDFGITYHTAAYDALSGGRENGRALEGTADFNFDCDLAKLAGWSALRFHLSLVAGHGDDISNRVGDANKISSFAVDPGLFLHEVWLERAWLSDRLTLRVGKLSADMEFPVYGYADTVTLPLYPTGGLGARLAYEPTPRWSFHAAVFDGDPNAPGRVDNPHGTHLRLGRSDGATLIGMISFNHGYADPKSPNPGTWKLGIYHNTRTHSDTAAGAPHRGNHALFFNGDVTLWREPSTVKDDDQGLALYLVGEYAPPDRNTYHYGYGGGPYYTGLFPGRNKDVAYLNLLYSRFGHPYSAASLAAGGPAYSYELRWQGTYEIAVTRYLTITPEINRVLRTGGTGTLRPATVVGLHARITF